ncbi:hypothetical protein OJAV_G00162900 [Oryzias javanicus]|uniref:Ig-like domain-containing protein n=1 Tax=Oryzias javanicus TaxID=123683 RepID=A0A3S2PCA7_ORYJA|nr:hypothetical protein OJAV_G00162900 [Oryzias javanicus]
MTRALSFLLLGCLLEDVFGNPYKVTLPQTVEAVTGSCLTIPCSFEVESNYEKDLNDNCKAIWKRTNVMNIKSPNLTTTKDMTGMYQRAKYNFGDFVVKVNIRDLPPSPTLTPSALTVKEGTSVSLTCSAPASCPSHPPTLTWTPKLADSQETLKENQDQTKVQISVLNFTASHLHHGKNITCTAVYWKQDGSSVSLHSSLTADIKFPPKILPLTNCTKTEVQVNCSCETEGIPSPALYWFLDGLPVNESENLKVKTESEIDTNLRSIITVTRPQKRNPFILLCFSVNSLGSASQQFLLTDPPQQGLSVNFIY